VHRQQRGGRETVHMLRRHYADDFGRTLLGEVETVGGIAASIRERSLGFTVCYLPVGPWLAPLCQCAQAMARTQMPAMRSWSGWHRPQGLPYRATNPFLGGPREHTIINWPARNLATVTGDATDLRTVNIRFFDALWRKSRLVGPECFNTWPVVQTFLGEGGLRLEIGPGLRPRLPIAETFFVDISTEALSRLRDRGGYVALATATGIPFPDVTFDLVCAFDIVEHVEDDDACFSELARLAKPGSIMLLSVPLHLSRWSRFDEIVGHYRRYDPILLAEKLQGHGFVIERSAPFGMRPRSSSLASMAMDLLAQHPVQGFWCYNNVLLPLAIKRQKPLKLYNGVVASDHVDDLLLLCRRSR
jgi:SAM-dependent methyltransferase